MKLFLPFILLIFPVVTPNEYNAQIPKLISSEVSRFTHLKKPTENLHIALKQLSKLRGKTIYNPLFCETCDLVFSQVINYRKGGASRESFGDFLKKLCNSLSDWGSIACTGYIDIELDTLMYIIDNKKDFSSQRACAIYFQKNRCVDPDPSKWVISLPKAPKQNTAQLNVQDEGLKVLHLTDFHFDPLYVPGNDASCNLPLCCQADNGVPKNATNAAGYWGDYRVCDTPWHSLVDLMTHVNGTKYDLIYYTGDIISHKSWASNKTSNTAAITAIYTLLNDSFGGQNVYPILGNHEPHPTDFWAPNITANMSISTQWVFDLAATQWQRWLPNTTLDTIRKGGYYTVLVRKGFRIIALNSNVCYTSNLWLLYNDVDPYDQLNWLVAELTKAQKAGERVHILSHIPPGEPQCLQQWGWNFKTIIERFSDVVTAQFNGHTHLDEIRFFKSPNDSKQVINVAYNAGSFTTFVGLNPNYRVYNVSTSDYSVLDYDHYTYNLTAANLAKDQPPKWYKIYSFKDAYDLKNTSLTSLSDLSQRFITNQTLVFKYFRNQVRDSEPQIKAGCGANCLKRVACTITAVDAISNIQC